MTTNDIIGNGSKVEQGGIVVFEPASSKKERKSETIESKVKPAPKPRNNSEIEMIDVERFTGTCKPFWDLYGNYLFPVTAYREINCTELTSAIENFLKYSEEYESIYDRLARSNSRIKSIYETLLDDAALKKSQSKLIIPYSTKVTVLDEVKDLVKSLNEITSKSETAADNTGDIGYNSKFLFKLTKELSDTTNLVQASIITKNIVNTIEELFNEVDPEIEDKNAHDYVENAKELLGYIQNAEIVSYQFTGNGDILTIDNGGNMPTAGVKIIKYAPRYTTTPKLWQKIRDLI